MEVGTHPLSILMWHRASSIDVFRYFLVKTLIKIPCKLYRHCSTCDSSKVCLWLTKQEILSKITADI